MCICHLRNDACTLCHTCSFAVCRGVSGNRYLQGERFEFPQRKPSRHQGEVCFCNNKSNPVSYNTRGYVKFEKRQDRMESRKQQVCGDNQRGFPTVSKTKSPEIKNDRRCEVDGNDTHPTVDMAGFGYGVESHRAVLMDAGKQVTKRCGRDRDTESFSESLSLLHESGEKFGKSSQAGDITWSNGESNLGVVLSNCLESDNRISSYELEGDNGSTAISAANVSQLTDRGCISQTTPASSHQTSGYQDNKVLDENKGRTSFQHLEFDKAYEQKPNKNSLFRDLKLLPHSNSLTFQDGTNNPTTETNLQRPTQRKEFSFPTLPNETLHHNVHSPSCKLNCTPNTCSPNSANTAEDVTYPLNITHDSLGLSEKSMDLNFLTEADNRKIKRLSTLNSIQNSGQTNKCSTSQNVCSNTNNTNDFSNMASITDDHAGRINNIDAARMHGDVPISLADKADNVENDTKEIINLNSEIDSRDRLENKMFKNMKIDDMETNGDISSYHTYHTKQNLHCRGTAGDAGEEFVLGPNDEDRNCKMLSEGSLNINLESLSLEGDRENEPDSMRKDYTRRPDAVSEKFSDGINKDSKSQRNPVISLPSIFSSSRDSRCRQMETLHVHEVYKQIAPQCDHVMHKAWPRVKRFLKDLDPGSLVADVGCGNGRYLTVNKSILKIGSDVCQPFLEQAKDQGHEIMMADNTALPYRDATFDATISIGVIHHFASLERRVKALSELARILSPGGKLMVYVWAFEQMHRKFESQDVLVPWVRPEGKGTPSRIGRRRTLLSSGHDYTSISSMGSSASEDETSTGPIKRLERQTSDNSSLKRSSRLSSADDPSADDDNSNSQSDDHRAKQKFGVFNRRDGTNKRRSKGDITKGSEENGDEDTVFDEDSYREEQELGENIDPSKPFSKWPGQLVSECRKLGKFLRSLSIKSDFHSDDGSDSLRVEDREDALGVDADFVQTQDGDDYGLCGAHTKLQVGKAVSETNLQGFQKTMNNEEKSPDAGQDKQVTDNHNKSELSKKRTNSESGITTGGCCCDVTEKESRYSSSVATSYHNVPLKTLSPVYSLVTSKFDHNTPFKNDNNSLHNGSFQQTEHLGLRDRGNVIPDTQNSENSSFTSLQLPTPTIISSSADESESTSSGNQDGPCSKSNTYTISGTATKSDRPSDAIVLASSDSCINPECLISYPINTVINRDGNDESSFNPTTGKCLFTIGSPNQMNAPFSQAASSCTADEPLIDSSNYVYSAPTLASRQNVTSCDNHIQCYDILKYEHLEAYNTGNHYFGPESTSLNVSRSNTSMEANFTASDLADGVDSDSVLSFGHGDISGSEHLPRIHSDTDTFAARKSVKRNNMATPSSDKNGDIIYDTDSVSRDDNLSPQFSPNELQDEHFQCSLDASNASQSTSTVRQTFKNIFTKLADVFSLRPVPGYKTFGSYQDGKYSNNPMIDSDTSENDTSLSNISTHSSCFHTSIYKLGWEKSPVAEGSTKDNDAFEVLEIPETRPTQAENQVCDKFTNLSNQYQKHGENTPISPAESLRETQIPKGHNSLPSKNLSRSQGDSAHSSMAKERIVQTLAQKWSSFLHKGKTCSPPKQTEYQHYSPVDVSSSDNEEEKCHVSTSDNRKVTTHKFKSPNRVMTKRPSSLDFTKKRTRGKGRLPGIFWNERTKSHKESKLSLADAMTLIGDGASEDSIVKRLDPSAKTIFAEMKRMNFAIRQFPKSSLDSDSNDDQLKPIPAGCNDVTTQTLNKPMQAQNKPPLNEKVRSDKKRSTRRRRFSDSITSQTVRSKRGKGIVKLQEEIGHPDIGASKGSCPLKTRRQVSRELGMSFDSTRARYTGAQSQLQTVDLFTPQASGVFSKESSESPEKLEEVSEKALVKESSTQTTMKEGTETLGKAGVCSIATKGKNSNSNATTQHTGVENSETAQAVHVQDDFCNAILAQLDSIIDHVQANKTNDHTDAMSTTSKAVDTNQSASHNFFSHPNTSVLSSVEKAANGFSTSTPPNTEEDNVNICAEKSKADNSLSRYYHVFKKGELDQLITDHVPSLKVVDTFYDHANWCIVAQKL